LLYFATLSGTALLVVLPDGWIVAALLILPVRYLILKLRLQRKFGPTAAHHVATIFGRRPTNAANVALPKRESSLKRASKIRDFANYFLRRLRLAESFNALTLLAVT